MASDKKCACCDSGNLSGWCWDCDRCPDYRLCHKCYAAYYAQRYNPHKGDEHVLKKTLGPGAKPAVGDVYGKTLLHDGRAGIIMDDEDAGGILLYVTKANTPCSENNLDFGWITGSAHKDDVDVGDDAPEDEFGLALDFYDYIMFKRDYFEGDFMLAFKEGTL